MEKEVEEDIIGAVGLSLLALFNVYLGITYGWGMVKIIFILVLGGLACVFAFRAYRSSNKSDI
ncbi:MAG: hypothetical protein ACOCZP_04165 [Candidatus Hadarchaeota archaeon]